MKKIFSALKCKNYRFFFVGQCISLLGSWIGQFTTIWLVYHLTQSALLLGLGGFAAQLPSFVLAPFGGVLVDQWYPRRLLLITQTLFMLLFFVLATLALTDSIRVWHLILLSIFQSVVTAFDMPARHAFVKEMVEDKKNLGNAIALNSGLVNGTHLIGPAIAGILIANVGAGLCFLIDSISYIAMIAALLAMKTTSRKIAAEIDSPWQRLKEGFTYASGFPPIRSILLLLVLVSFMGLSYTVLVPVLAATQNLYSGPDIYGFMMAASGFGALIGSIYLSSQPSVVSLEKLIAFSPTTLGIGLIVLSLSQLLEVSLLMMMLIGLSSVLITASSNTVFQKIVEDNKRGRLMSLYTMAVTGMAPFGSLYAGGLASIIGVPNTLIISGISCISGSLIFTRLNSPRLENDV